MHDQKSESTFELYVEISPETAFQVFDIGKSHKVVNNSKSNDLG